MRVVSVHPDVIVVGSALLQINCVIVRGRANEHAECFVIDSPVLPEELDALPAVIEQARFPAPDGLLASHGDWDHLLARLAFPDVALACPELTAARLRAAPGEPQRELRAFDEELLIERPRPLALGAVQGLPVPGRCELGGQELELHLTAGHTPDGMAVLAPWAEVLVTGDYLSTCELPTLAGLDALDAYLDTLSRLRDLLERVAHVVPGHGPVLSRERATEVLDEDVGYLISLGERGAEIELPSGRRNAANRARHMRTAATL